MPELQVKIPAHDGDVFGAYIAMPEVTPAPAIIVIQEIFGINAEIRAKCDELAAQGYVAIAPDLFWRMETGLELDPENEEELNKAFDLYNNFDILAGIEELKNLKKVMLISCKMKEFPEEICRNRLLEEVVLNGNPLGNIPDSIQNLR